MYIGYNILIYFFNVYIFKSVNSLWIKLLLLKKYIIIIIIIIIIILKRFQYY